MNKDNKGSILVQLENKGAVRFDYDLTLFGKPSGTYDHEMCRLACKFSTVGYDRITEDPAAEAETGFLHTQKGLKTLLDGMGFTRQEICPTAARDEQTYFIALRPLTLGDTKYDLYVTALIGSYKKAWFSDFDPLGLDRVCNGGVGYAGDTEAGAVHLGFADARDFMYARIRDFILRTRSGRPIKLLITGHSRGAAAANLLGAKILTEGGLGDEIPILPDDVFIYAFATPNYADRKKVKLRDPRLKRIYNVVFPEDFVTEVFPKASGFGKFGTVYALMGADNLSKADYAREKAVMTRFFMDYRTSRPYAPFKEGSRAVRKVIAVLAQNVPDMETFYTGDFRLCFKRCTPFEYFRSTLCTIVGGNDSPEDQANIDRATKLLLASAFDGAGTSRVFRKMSAFFVFKQGLAGATGGKFGAENFNDAHICETYLAYLMSMREDQLIKEQ